tara:strand:- start:55 stop:1371 length:1317 start_codon:yes stop_codon:yes gene_type:complete
MNKKERLRELRKYNNNEKRIRNFNFNSLLLLIIIFGLGGIAYFLYDNGYFSEQKSVILVTPTATVPSPPTQISPPPTQISPPPTQIPSPPTPTITPPPTPTITPPPTQIPPTPTLVPKSLSYEELVNKNIDLKRKTLELVNEVRLKNRLNPLTLGSNPAAQIHAEDAIKYGYQSHWMANGEKPYMVYSRTGGDSYARENVSSRGWSPKDWIEYNCDSPNVLCNPKTPLEATYLSFEDLMNSKGHRENILDPTHLKLNMGIAWDENKRYYSFVQQFEGGHFTIKNISFKDDYLSFSILNNSYDYTFNDETSVRIVYDPLPQSVLDNEGYHTDKFRSVCVGGGYSSCENRGGENDVAIIRKPLEDGYYYDNMETIELYALEWKLFSSNSILPADKLSISAKLDNAKSMKNPGVYTILFWGKNIASQETELLIKRSFVIEK